MLARLTETPPLLLYATLHRLHSSPPPDFSHFQPTLLSLESFPLSKIDKNLGGTEIVFVGGVNLRTLNRNRNPNRIETPRSHNCEQKTEVAAAHLATSPAGAGTRGKGEDGRLCGSYAASQGS